MSLVTFAPFGRGSIADTGDLDDPYDTLRALSLAQLDARNFHPNAQIHESYVEWDRHKHLLLERSLGRGIITNRHLDTTPDSNGNCQFLHASTPKTLVLYGSETLNGSGFGNSESQSDYVQTVRFDTTSLTKQGFLSGTVPLVFLTLRPGDDDLEQSERYRLVLISTSSFEFSFGVVHADTDLFPAYSFPFPSVVHYLAVGRAPGVIQRPDGVVDGVLV